MKEILEELYFLKVEEDPKLIEICSKETISSEDEEYLNSITGYHSDGFWEKARHTLYQIDNGGVRDCILQ